MTIPSLDPYSVAVTLAVVIALLALRPYLPEWTVYVVAGAFVLYAFFRMFEEGLTQERVGSVLLFVWSAVWWWYVLRRTKQDEGAHKHEPPPDAA